jgi:hypothetical protein
MKISIEISRSAVINTGNYNTIKPGVLLRIDDIPVEQIEAKSKILSELVENLFIKEFISMSSESNTISEIGYPSYSRALELKEELVKENIEKLYKNLLE